MEQVYLLLITYKIATLLTGVLLCYWGYRLFLSIPVKDAGEINFSLQKKELRFKRAAPGAFFVLFGATIIIAAIYMGVNMEKMIKTEEQVNQTPKPLLK